MASTTQQTALRKIGDDPMLRPFLSSLFDPNAYVKSIIKDGKSDECFAAVTTCIEKINEEIQVFISKNKDSLMGSMQDVSSLAARYRALAEHSKRLQGIVGRMKRETADSYNVIKSRISELERVHHASVLLGHLRRFVYAKSQLDQFLPATPAPSATTSVQPGYDTTDLRNISTAAKLVGELEKLLQVEALQEVDLVQSSMASIKSFGTQLRMQSQTALLNAVHDKNQASIANYLQVFYNLESLPEIVLMVVDHTAKQAADAVRETLSLDHVSALYHDYLHKTASQPASGGGAGGVGGSGTPSVTAASASKARGGGASGSGAATASAVSLSQVRIAMRELAHAFSNLLFTRATQILVVQRVLMKKEDPATHERFIDVLSRALARSSALPDSQTSSNDNSLLLRWYWTRLSQLLSDVCAEKLRSAPDMAARLYPYLRKAVVTDVLQGLALAQQEDMSSSATGSSLMTTSGAIFGSSLWSSLQQPQQQQTTAGSQSSLLSASGIPSDSSSATAASTRNAGGQAEHELVLGLRPLRDRYLLGALDRMNAPITQMFPDLDGYIAAVPSKRDLQMLIKALQQEFITAATESEIGLVSQLAREALKPVQLFLTKVESMILTTSETRKLAVQQQFARNHAQEHNGQCFLLLVQFREALEKLPSQVVQHLDDGSVAGGSTGSGAVPATPQKLNTAVTASHSAHHKCASLQLSFAERVHREIASATVGPSCNSVDELATRQVLDPIVTLVQEYSLSVLVQLHKELVVHLPTVHSSAVTSSQDPAMLENSLAVQSLLRHLPTLVKAQLAVLSIAPTPAPASSAPTSTGAPSSSKSQQQVLVDRALEELALRVLVTYISTAALVRPANELTRLRAAKDLTALEVTLASWVSLHSLQQCPVMKEYRAFRRLLFEEKIFVSTTTDKSQLQHHQQSQQQQHHRVPDRQRLFSLDYLQDLRPSTLLATLMAMGPVQLPLPSDTSQQQLQQGRDLQQHIAELVRLDGRSSSVRLLYLQASVAAAVTSSGGSGATPGTGSVAAAGGGRTVSSWKRVPAEQRAWEQVQQCLDVFFQRLSAAEGAQKQEMRIWYETILDIGSSYFY